MAQLTAATTPEFKTSVPALTVDSVAHPDTWNPVHQILLDNTAALKAGQEQATEAIGDVAARVGELEETSSVSVQRAVTLDWLYRDNRIAFELWAPGFTLIDAIDTAIVQGVAGDDSVDVASTAQLKANEYYVLADADGSLLVRCTAILSDQRIRISDNLPRSLGAGVLTRCSMRETGAAYATAMPGDRWLSKSINIGNDADGGAIVIRRTLNSGDARMYYRDAYTAVWTERIWSTRRQGGDIPAGFADYEYSLPMRGDGNLMIVVEGEEMQIQHIVALSVATGLGGFINPAMRPAAPTVSAPAAGATGITERPTLAITGYSSPGGTAHDGTQFQISTSNTFATVTHDTGTIAGMTYSMPAGVLAVGTTYYERSRVRDVAGLWSDWSAVSSFTTAASFAYVATPTLVSPAADATDVGETPTLQTGAFAVVGGTDTHAASQWQARTAAGSWVSPLWDSGEDTTNKLSRALPAGILQAGQNVYYLRARHKGTAKGWSEYSSEVKITTKTAFASVAGVVCLATGGNGGTWGYIDDAGNTIAAPGATYFNAHPVFGGMQDVTIDGQAMVKVPKFYTKRGIVASGANAGKEAWWISDQPLAGYAIHPAFRNAGADIDQFYYGKYQASSDGTKLKSVAGVAPAVSKSLTTFQTEAAARNTGGVTGFMQLSFFQWSAIQWLYLVENATMDSQTKTGQGRVNASSAANVDAADVAQATYRGIVGLWGNVYQWVDGLKTVSGIVNLWDKNGNKSWVSTGVKRAAADGTIYPTTFMDDSGTGFDFDDVFIGDTGPTSNSSATAPDYQYFTSSGEYFPIVGGHWGYAAGAGLWIVYCNGAASNTGTNIGSRLAKV